MARLLLSPFSSSAPSSHTSSLPPLHRCIYCQSECQFTRSNLTCMNCGTEQGVPVFEDEWNVADRTCDFYTHHLSRYPEYSDGPLYPEFDLNNKNKNKSATRPNSLNDDLFTRIQENTKLPDSTMELAKSMNHSYLQDPKKHHIKGEQRRLEFCAACTYFATKSMSHGVLSLNRVVELVFKNNVISLHWACKELLETFWNDKRYSELFRGRDMHVTEAITRISKLVGCISRDGSGRGKDNERNSSNDNHNDTIPVKDIYKLAHKMLDKIKRIDEAFVNETQSERLAASLVFVGCKLMKKSIPLHAMAMLSGTNEGHLLKLESKIKVLIKG